MPPVPPGASFTEGGRMPPGLQKDVRELKPRRMNISFCFVSLFYREVARMPAGFGGQTVGARPDYDGRLDLFVASRDTCPTI